MISICVVQRPWGDSADIYRAVLGHCWVHPDCVSSYWSTHGPSSFVLCPRPSHQSCALCFRLVPGCVVLSVSCAWWSGPAIFFVFLFHPVSAFGVRFGLELFFFDFHTATLLPFCLCNIPYPFATTRAKQQKKREANRIKNRRETDKQPLFHPWGWCRILRLVLRPSISSILIRIGIAPALLLLFCSWLTTPIPSLWKSPGFRFTLAVWFPFDADKL